MTLETWLRLAEMTGSWLLTYALHSTVFLALAWLAAACLGGRSLGTEEGLWRLALLAGVLTASIQLARPVEPPSGARAALASRSEPFAETVAEPAAARPLSIFAPSSTVTSSSMGAPSPAPAVPTIARTKLEVPAFPSKGAPRAAARIEGSPLWLRGLAAGWMLIATAGLVGFAVRWRDLRRCLRDRVELREGTLPARLRALAARAGLQREVRLTMTDALSVPFARGVLRPEVCLPERMLGELPPSQQEAVLAHEVAHLGRRDPLWILVLRVLKTLFFFQPFNYLATRRLLEISELQADDWAARSTGRGRELAAGLASVASWIVRTRGAEPLPALARRRSRLGQRIERLLDGSPAKETRWLARGAAWLSAAAVMGLLAGVPGLAVSASEGDASAPLPPAPPAVATPPAAPAPPSATPASATSPTAPPALARTPAPVVAPAPPQPARRSPGPPGTPPPPRRSATAPAAPPALEALPAQPAVPAPEALPTPRATPAPDPVLAPLPTLSRAPRALPTPSPEPALAPLAEDFHLPRPEGISDAEWQKLRAELDRAREQVRLQMEEFQARLSGEHERFEAEAARALDEAQRSLERAVEEARRQELEQAAAEGVAGSLEDLERERAQEDAARRAMADAERLLSVERGRLEGELRRAEAEISRMNAELDAQAKALEDARRELERLRWTVQQESSKKKSRRAEPQPPPPR